MATGCPWGHPRHPVSLDTWHAMIALPREPKAEAPGSLEEWGYAERAWYLEGRQELSGVFRALLWPSAGVVEVFVGDHVWAEQTPQPAAEVFTFRLTEDAYQRLRRYLRATLAAEEPSAVIGSSRFYPARESYHLFAPGGGSACLAALGVQPREPGAPAPAGGAPGRGPSTAGTRAVIARCPHRRARGATAGS